MGPGFFSAFVATLLIATATAGAMATPPPAAPVFASVVIASVDEALRESVATPVSVAPAPSSALVFTSIKFSATDAPSPTLVAPVVAESALVFDVDSDCALNEASPPPALAELPSASAAVVAMLPATKANEPATLTDPPPPAPLVACADRS